MLLSIVRQTYTNLQIVIGDNRTEGNPNERFATSLNDHRITFYYHRINRGGAYNRDFVASKAIGELFVFAADDDEWEPTYIEECVKALEDPRIVMAYSPAKKTFGGKWVLIDDRIDTMGFTARDGIRIVIRNLYSNIAFYGVVRKSVYDRYRFQNVFGEDFSYLVYLSTEGKIKAVNPGLFINGDGYAGTSVSRTAKEQGLSMISRRFGYLILMGHTIQQAIFQWDTPYVGDVIVGIVRRMMTRRFMKSVAGSMVGLA